MAWDTHKDRPEPWLQGGLGHGASTWLRSQLRKKETGRRDNCSARGTKMGGKTPPPPPLKACNQVLHSTSGKSKLSCSHFCGGLKGKHTRSLTPQHKQGRGTHTHRCNFPEGKDNAVQPTPRNKPTTTSNTQKPVTCSRAARRPQTSTCQGASQVRTKAKCRATHPEYRAGTLSGHQQATALRGRGRRGREKALTLITGWPWGPAGSVSHSGAERWLSPSLQGATLPRQP